MNKIVEHAIFAAEIRFINSSNNLNTMEKEEKNKQEFIAANADEQVQQETQKENVDSGQKEEQPKKKNFLKRLVILCVIGVVVGVSAVLIIRHLLADAESAEYVPKQFPIRNGLCYL